MASPHRSSLGLLLLAGILGSTAGCSQKPAAEPPGRPAANEQTMATTAAPTTDLGELVRFTLDDPTHWSSGAAALRARGPEALAALFAEAERRGALSPDLDPLL